jgi:hypothetical protein
LSAFVALSLASPAALAAPTYTDIALGDGAGISYRRIASATNAQFDAIKMLPFMSQVEMNATPLFPRGAPGVAILDYDRDGDQDIFVTNGPGRANSLYQNQRAQGGGTTFVDVGAIDNDGDDDLYVLGRMEQNRLFRNNGNGTFSDITAASGLGAGITSHTSCSMGDIDNDGLLDVVVSNTFDWTRQEAIFTDLFDYNHPNQLFKNQGGNVFTDVTASSGFLNLTPGLPPEVATISWAIAMVDLDLDGDVDIMHADDQAGLPVAAFGGVNRGYLQVFRNNGSGQLTNITHATPNPTDPLNAEPAQWMGLSYGDMDCNGTMDVFATALGSYMPGQFGAPAPPILFNSRWFHGTGAGEFVQPAEALRAPPGPFGWGTGMFDYDNDLHRRPSATRGARSRAWRSAISTTTATRTSSTWQVRSARTCR